MGDVADILGFNPQSTTNTYHPNTLLDEANRILNDKPKGLNSGPKNAKKPKGMSREVFSLMGADGFVPTIQGNKQTLSNAFKSKRTCAVRGKWIWTPFANSARGDETIFHHWVKADIQYADYPYAKFNVSIDPIQFSDEEYTNLLQSKSWTKEETVYMLELAVKYGLRWPVITDRYELEPYRSLEDIQGRYYTIVSKLREYRLGVTHTNLDYAKDDNQVVFNLEQERRRKHQLEIQYRKTKEEEYEEQQLREELKAIDALLKKSKKMAKAANTSTLNSSNTYSFISKDSSSIPQSTQPLSSSNDSSSSASTNASASSTSATTTSNSSSSNSGSSVIGGPTSSYPVSSTVPSDSSPSAAIIYSTEDIKQSGMELKEGIPSVVVVPPTPGKPYLQSARLIITETALGIPKTITKRLNTLLQDLGAPDFPLPTKTVCDLYDQIRLEGITLVSLQASILRKEKELTAYRAVEKSMGVFESFSKDTILPQSAMLHKLPSESIGEKVPFPPIPSSPQRPPIATTHDYGDLISTLGVALLAVETNALDIDSSNGPGSLSSGGTKKATKRKGSNTNNGGSNDGTPIPEGADKGDGQPPKKTPKRSRPKPKVEGGMDPEAIRAAALSAIAGGILESSGYDKTELQPLSAPTNVSQPLLSPSGIFPNLPPLPSTLGHH